MYPWMFNEIATLWKKPCNNGYTNTVYPQYVLFCVITAYFSLQRTSHVGYTDMVYSQQVLLGDLPKNFFLCQGLLTVAALIWFNPSVC